MQNPGFIPWLHLLAFMAGAAAFGAVAGVLLARPAARDAKIDHHGAGSVGVLPTFMMLLAALAIGAGVLLLVPAGMILRYFPSWRVAAMLIAAVFVLAVPLVYAWRTRPF